MVTVIRVVFDGKVFRPQEPVDLEPNTSYTITIESELADDSNRVDVVEGVEEHPLTAIRRLAKDMGVTDLSTNHDWYAHGRIPDPQDGE